MSSSDVVVAGHICLDIIPNMDDLPYGKLASLLVPGRLINVGPATFSTGGAVSNTGIALHKLGMDTRLVGKIGNDPYGKIVKQIVNSHARGKGNGLLVDAETSTSYTVILSAPGVDRIFLHSAGANDTFRAADIPEDALKSTRLFHFGYPPLIRTMYADGGDELAEICRKASAAGATVSLDLSLPDIASDSGKVDWLSILAKSLPAVDVFVPSFEELLFCLRRKVYDDLMRDAVDGQLLHEAKLELVAGLARQVLEFGVKIVMIKLGEAGLYLRTAGANALKNMGRGAPADAQDWANLQLRASSFAVNVAGTTGAGDATIAGFLAGLLRGLGPQDAVNSAVAVGACNVEAHDALGGLRSWEVTQERIANELVHRPLEMNEDGWNQVRDGVWEKRLG